MTAPVPEDDAAEQRRAVVPDEPPTDAPRPLEADEGDVAEQSVAVPFDEDESRS